MLSEHGSLVKYSTPVLMSSLVKAKKGDEQEDILGSILPPKETKTEGGQTWLQTVLSTPATKIEVIQLHEQLEKRLVARQAREIGLCPVREELFDQCFDEIIRQITIDCRQRGLLLVRIRDQYRNQIRAYKNLYESSISHSMRRVIDSDEKKTQMQLTIATLEKDCAQLEKVVSDLGTAITTTKTNETKRLSEKAEAHKSKVNEIKERNHQLKTEIQNALEKNK